MPKRRKSKEPEKPPEPGPEPMKPEELEEVGPGPFRVNDVVAVAESDSLGRSALDNLSYWDETLPKTEKLRGKFGKVVSVNSSPGIVESYKGRPLEISYEVKFNYHDASENESYSFSAFLWNDEVRPLTEAEMEKYGEETIFVVRGEFPEPQYEGRPVVDEIVETVNAWISQAKTTDAEVEDVTVSAGHNLYIYSLELNSNRIIYAHSANESDAGKKGLVWLDGVLKAVMAPTLLDIRPLKDYTTYAHIAGTNCFYRMEEEKWRLLRPGERPGFSIPQWRSVFGVFIDMEHSPTPWFPEFVPPSNTGIPFLATGDTYILEWPNRNKLNMVVTDVRVDGQTMDGSTTGTLGPSETVWISGTLGGDPFDQILSTQNMNITILDRLSKFHGSNILVPVDKVLFILGNQIHREVPSGDRYICTFVKGRLWNISGRYRASEKKTVPSGLKLMDPHPFVPNSPPIVGMYCIGVDLKDVGRDLGVRKIVTDTGNFEVNGDIKEIRVSLSDDQRFTAFRLEPMGFTFFKGEQFDWLTLGDRWTKPSSVRIHSPRELLRGDYFVSRAVVVLSAVETGAIYVYPFVVGHRANKIMVTFDEDGNATELKIGKDKELFADLKIGSSTKVFTVENYVLSIIVSVQDLLPHGGGR